MKKTEASPLTRRIDLSNSALLSLYGRSVAKPPVALAVKVGHAKKPS